ncbi:hypothetical protein THIX_90094 [Thiomonas sp. X19]|nr:hypothetical protein THIX_90094 [Thiomonas sp. X19]
MQGRHLVMGAALRAGNGKLGDKFRIYALEMRCPSPGSQPPPNSMRAMHWPASVGTS